MGILLKIVENFRKFDKMILNNIMEGTSDTI